MNRLERLATGTLLAAALLWSGCVTRTPINDVMAPLASIRARIISVYPGGVRIQSENGRMITSHYYNPENPDSDEDADQMNERAFVVSTILGERRPYRIDVKGYIETRLGRGRYSAPKRDQLVETQMIEQIKAALANRPEERSVLDDFRAF
jgi:hypothetical protein